MQLEARNISFAYKKGNWVFRGLNLTINPGEIIGLTGESGCGKSTFARIVAGYLCPGEGSILLNNKPLPVKDYSPVQLVFQHPEKALNPRWQMQQILEESFFPDDSMLSALSIEKQWYKRWPNELSGGELQRFCLARVLNPFTRFLIADEMTAMLDAITQAQLWKVVMDFSFLYKVGVLVISHEAALLDRICSRVITLDSV